MSFASFDTAVDGFCDFLASMSWPSSLRWLVKSRVRWNRRGFFVYQPNSLTDSEPHRDRFELALEQNKNIAFIAYTDFNGYSLIGLETLGLDPPNTDFNESGSHNYKTFDPPLQLISVDSAFVWRLTKLIVSNNYPAWNCLGWPH